MNDSVKAMIRKWLLNHNGDVEGTAKWMRDRMRIGGISQCRAFIAEATA